LAGSSVYYQVVKNSGVRFGREMIEKKVTKRISTILKMVCGLAALVALILAIMNAPSVKAQSKTQAQASTPRFEVASIRPSSARNTGGSKSTEKGGGGPPSGIDHNRFTETGTLYGFILRAYGIRICRVGGLGTCPVLSGGPTWLKQDRFEIRAKMPDNSPDYTFRQYLNGQTPQLQLMLQALLVERFNLKVHRENKQLPAYALVIGKNGSKLKKSGAVEMLQMPDGSSIENRGVMFRPVATNKERMVQLVVKNQSVQQMADTFATFLGRPVLDRTGLKGDFDFTMEYETDPDADNLPGSELVGPALFTALQEQAGLKMESTKGTVEVLVIDHAEKPSEN